MERLRMLGTAGAIVVALASIVSPVHGQPPPDAARGERQLMIRHVSAGDGGSSIGVAVRDVEQTDAAKGVTRGAVIERVQPGSPAEKAGFKIGDVIVAFDGEAVRGSRQFARLVEETPSGRPVPSAVLRNGSKVELTVVPAADRAASMGGRGVIPPDAMAELDRLPELRSELDRVFGQGTLGVAVQPISRELAEFFGARHGVLVESVRESSAAAKAGIRVGDVITAVNEHPVESPSELRRFLREAGSVDVSIGIVREKKALTLKAKLQEPERQMTRELRRGSSL